MHGELAKLGISISQAAVSKYMVRHRTPPSHTWRSFLDNHVNDLVSLDFFTLPTATFRVLFVFIVLRHDRRRIVHFNVTEHPSAEWTAQQRVNAFPWDTAPRYLVRDRDQTYGAYFDSRVDGLGMEQVLTAPRSPWQNPFVERMIGSIQRECLDHVVVLDEQHLRRILRCLRCLLLVMCTYPFAKKELTLYLACGEGRERYFGCNLMQRKVLASSHQHLMAEAPTWAGCANTNSK